MPIQMYSGSAEREDSTSSKVFVDLVPTPGHIFNATASGSVSALFVCECRLSTQRGTPSLTARITVDGNEMHPGPAVLTTHNRYETRAHFAFAREITAGQHHVVVQWKVTSGKAYVHNRSLTIWVQQ